MSDIFRVIETATRRDVTEGLDLEEIALMKPWAKKLCYCDMEGWAVGSYGELYLLDECGCFVYPPEGEYRVEWIKPNETGASG